MTFNLGATELLAGFGALVSLFMIWRSGARRAKAAAKAARSSVRLLSLGGRVLITASVIVGVQWVVISYASANRWLVLAALGLPALLGLLHAHSCVDRDHLGQGRSVMMAQDAKHVPLTTAQKLVQDAAEAAEVRAYLTHLDGVALRIQHIRTQVDRMCWGGIVLVLAFTVTNVLGFASAGSPGWSLAWLAAWVLDQPAPAASRALPGGGRPDVEHATWAKVPVSDGRTRIV